jgi:hypothetical protein
VHPGAVTHAGTPGLPSALWRNPEPERAYDVVTVGAGGRGMATAHHHRFQAVTAPTSGTTVPVQVTSPVFVDPGGTRRDG